MILQWQHEGNVFKAKGEYHEYEIEFDEVGKASLTQTSRVSPGIRINSGFVGASRMMGQAQQWESEVAPPEPVRRRPGHRPSGAHAVTGHSSEQTSRSQEHRRWTDRVFSWGPFGSGDAAGPPEAPK